MGRVLGSPSLLVQFSTHATRLSFAPGAPPTPPPSLPSFTSAGVAGHPILWPSPRSMFEEGLWEGEASLWRVRPPESTGKLGGKVVTNMFLRDMDLGKCLWLETTGVWKWSSTACR